MKAVSFILAAALILAGPAISESYVIEANGNLPGDLGDLVAAAGGSLLRVHPEIGVAVAASDSSGFAAELIASSSHIASCTEDVMVQWTPDFDGEAVATPQSHNPVDPTTAGLYPCQWNLRQIDAPGAWAQDAFGDPNVKVAVLDTGVDANHVDLAGKVDLAESRSMLSPGSSPCNSVLLLPDEETIRDFNFHGTFVSSQITSNSLGMAGVAPLTRIVGVKVLNCTGSGSFADVIAGILYAASLDDVHVINMSLGAYFDRAGGAGVLIGPLAKAVNFAASKGKLVVSASGNNFADLQHDGSLISVPAESGSGISIYSTNVNDERALYANHGDNATWVGAPGGDGVDPDPPLPGCPLSPTSQGGVLGACSTDTIFIPACAANGLYLINGTGTSFASPIAAGVAALVDGEAGGALNGGQLKAILANTADDLGPTGVDNEFSHGRVNAAQAVQ